MKTTNAVALLAALALLLVGAAAAQVFPTRWDDEPLDNVTAAASATSGAAVMGGLLLTPQDAPPVACSSSTEGYIYIQRDLTAFSATFSSVLCVCVHDDLATEYRYYNTGNQQCSSFHP